MPMRQLYISLPPLAPLLDTQKQSRLSFYRLPSLACLALFQRLLLNRHTSCTAFSRLARVLCMPTLNSDLTLPHSLARSLSCFFAGAAPHIDCDDLGDGCGDASRATKTPH